MIRRIVGSLAVTALLVTGAQAQTPTFQDTFTFQSIGGSPGSIFVIGSVNAMTGSFATSHSPIVGSGSFQIWCVDETNNSLPISSGNPPYKADATLFSDITADDTYLHGGTNATKYREAAWLTTQMQGTDDNATFTSAALGVTDNAAIQLAIWEVMGYTGYSSSAFYAPNSSKVGAAYSAAISSANYNTVDLTQWFVITDVSGTCGNNPPAASCNQEFIAHVSVTPEPGTMALLAMGLVGMSGAGFRRRKNKK